jgi:hypothetical protein
MIKNELEKEIVIVTTLSLIRLFDLNPDAVTLYIFYCKNAKLQDTSSVYATDTFCMKGLKWGDKKLYKIKKILIDNGFITQDIRRNDEGKIEGYFIKIHYLIHNPTSTLESQSHQKPVQVKAGTGERGANTIDKNINTIDKNINTEDKKEKKIQPEFDIEVQSIFNFWNSLDLTKHKELTTGLQFTINNALGYVSEEKLKQTITNYSEIVKSDLYFFKYKWSLADFLTRGLSAGGLENKKGFWMFLPESNPFEQFAKTKSIITNANGNVSSIFDPMTLLYDKKKILDIERQTYYGYDLNEVKEENHMNVIYLRYYINKDLGFPVFDFEAFCILERVIIQFLWKRNHDEWKDNEEFKKRMIEYLELWNEKKLEFKKQARDMILALDNRINSN